MPWQGGWTIQSGGDIVSAQTMKPPPLKILAVYGTLAGEPWTPFRPAGSDTSPSPALAAR
jgi:hypothetical protein